MKQLMLSMVLLFGFQSCHSTSDQLCSLIDTCDLRIASKNGELASPSSFAGESSSGDEQSPLRSPSRELVSLFQDDTELTEEETQLALAWFENIALAFYQKEQVQMSQEFVQVMELLQDERIARALFERICLVELKKQFKQFKQQVQLERKINKCLCREANSLKRLLRNQRQEFERLVQREKCIKQELCSREDLLQREKQALHQLKQKALYLFGVASIKNQQDFIDCPAELWPKVHSEFKNRLVVRFFKVLGKLCLV